MLEQLKYINHMNEVLEFGKGKLFVNSNDLRDFAWEIATKNNRISGFKKGIVSKTIPVILKCDSESEGIDLRNRVFDVFEKDVLTKKHGKIHIGDYYLRCYITGSKKSQYLIDKGYMVISLTVQTDLPDWVKETISNHVTRYPESQQYLDYPYDFNHDFTLNFTIASVNNTGFTPSDFIMDIHGLAQSPSITIANHKYAVDVTVNDGDHLTINSVEKTIELHKANGETVNCFNNRNRDSYIFEKIPSGFNVVTSNIEGLKFTITLLEERSEPRWT